MKDRLLACVMILLANSLQGFLYSQDANWNLFGSDVPLVADGEVVAEKSQEKKTESKPEHRLKMLTAKWCGPCQGMKRNFDRYGIAHKDFGKPQVYEVDINEHPDQWRSSGERYIPCFILEKWDADEEEWIEVDRKRRQIGAFDARKIYEKWPELPRPKVDRAGA